MCLVSRDVGRDTCLVFYMSRDTAVFSTEEGGDDVKSAWPSDTLGYTRDTMPGTTRRNIERWSKSLEKRAKFG